MDGTGIGLEGGKDVTERPSRLVSSTCQILLSSTLPHPVGRNGIEKDGMEINSTEMDRTGRVGKKGRLHER